MSGLINKSGIRAFAKSLGIRIGSDAFPATEERIQEMLKHAAKKATVDGRKTILKRDLVHQRNLFDID